MNIFLCAVLMLAVAAQCASTLLLWAKQVSTRKAIRRYSAAARYSGVEKEFWKILHVNSMWGESSDDIERRWDARIIQRAYAKAIHDSQAHPV